VAALSLLGPEREIEPVVPPLEHEVVLAPLTSFGIGGPAELFMRARSAAELAGAVGWARERGVPVFVLGLGANILVGDRGVRGLVVANAARAFLFEETRLVAESGVVMYPDLIEESVSRGLSGLEHYVEIPSTVGGAMWQNLHFLSPDRSRTMFIEEVVRGAAVLTASGVERVDRDWFEFGYDTSSLHQTRDVVLEVEFGLETAEEETLREVMRANAAWRHARHPPDAARRSAGSIFQKLEGIGAGRLIEAAGLKGARIGGAEVAHEHANYIVNIGGATARDVRDLIGLVQSEVERDSGHRLQPEISLIGEF
jgi:UDP-N-acetylmuramate dehydrogenase